MSKSKLRLDINSLTPRQRRRIFLKKFRNICQMTINSNLEIQNNIVSLSNGPGNIEQLPQQQNVLKKIDIDYSNVMNTHKCTENNHDLVSKHSEISIDKNSFQLSISSDKFSKTEFCKTELINDIRLWAIENRVSHSAISSLLKILVKYGHNLPIDARTLFQTPKQVDIIEMTPGKYYHAGLGDSLKKSIRKHYCRSNLPSQININVNIDGLPLTKSSSCLLLLVFFFNITNVEKNYPIPKVRIINGKKIIKSVQCKGFYLSTRTADNCCLLLDGTTISLTTIF
ncbi:hypothetical protein ACS0PU_009737 [Formica fusca]